MSSSMLKRFLAPILMAAGFSISGCSDGGAGGGSAVEIGDREQILHIGNGDEPADVDPHITAGLPEYRIQIALFEGLVSRHPKTLEAIPGVAESWEISDDQKVYTFHIRDNAKWSNNQPITAQDFVWSWRRALMPALGNQYAYSLFVLKNAEAFHKGELKDFEQVGVKALDDKTLQVTLHSPTLYFLQLLDHHSFYPVHPETIKAHGAIDDRGTRWTRPENFVGNGPFTIKEWSPNRVFTVEKNPNYWDAEQVSLQEVHFYPIQQSTTEERMFRAGQLHATYEMPISKRQVYKRANHPALRTQPLFTTYMYMLNTKKPPLDDVRVRKALAYSIDRKAIVEHVTQGGQQPAFNITPPDILGYTAEAQLEYNLERARELLAEAGYPNGEGFPSVEILYNTHEDHRKIAVTVQQMWKQELNIDITLQNQDWKVYLSNMKAGNFEVARFAWGGDYLDPSTFLKIFISDGGNNETGWGTERYDELLELAAATADREERNGYFQEAEAILVDEVPAIPVYIYNRNRLVRPSVKGWHENVLDYHPYKYISLEPLPEPLELPEE